MAFARDHVYFSSNAQDQANWFLSLYTLTISFYSLSMLTGQLICNLAHFGFVTSRLTLLNTLGCSVSQVKLRKS